MGLADTWLDDKMMDVPTRESADAMLYYQADERYRLRLLIDQIDAMPWWIKLGMRGQRRHLTALMYEAERRAISPCGCGDEAASRNGDG